MFNEINELQIIALQDRLSWLCVDCKMLKDKMLEMNKNGYFNTNTLMYKLFFDNLYFSMKILKDYMLDKIVGMIKVYEKKKLLNMKD